MYVFKAAFDILKKEVYLPCSKPSWN